MRWLLIVFVLFGCSETPDCFQSRGATISTTIDVPSFNAITLYDDISLIITNGPQNVMATTGENLQSKLHFDVVDQTLSIRNFSSCNWARSYEKTTITISLPDFREIQLLGFGTLESEKLVSSTQLRIISLDSPSDVDISLNGGNLSISSNNVSNFKLTGTVENLDVGFYYGDGILFAQSLDANNITITHKGSNAMHLAPQTSLTGELSGQGNIHLHHNPSQLDVKVSGTGKLVTEY